MRGTGGGHIVAKFGCLVEEAGTFKRASGNGEQHFRECIVETAGAFTVPSNGGDGSRLSVGSSLEDTRPFQGS